MLLSRFTNIYKIFKNYENFFKYQAFLGILKQKINEEIDLIQSISFGNRFERTFKNIPISINAIEDWVKQIRGECDISHQKIVKFIAK